MNKSSVVDRSSRWRVAALALISSLFAFAAVAQPQMSEAELALLREGVQLHNAGKFEEAIAKYRSALEIDQTNGATHHQIAFAHAAQGDNQQCLAAATQGVELAKEALPDLYSIAGSCADNVEDYEVAAKFFDEGVARFPDSQRLLYNAAIHKLRVEQNDAALGLVSRSIEANPHHASSHFAAAMILGFKEETALAQLAVLRFLSLEPAGPRALEGLGMFEGLFRAAEAEGSPQSEAGHGPDNPVESLEAGEERTLGSIRMEAPQNEEDEAALVDVVLQAVRASTHFSPDGEPHFPDYSRRSDIVGLIAGATKLEADTGLENLAGRYKSFFSAMHEQDVAEAFANYVLQMVAAEVETWAGENPDEVQRLGQFLRSH